MLVDNQPVYSLARVQGRGTHTKRIKQLQKLSSEGVITFIASTKTTIQSREIRHYLIRSHDGTVIRLRHNDIEPFILGLYLAMPLGRDASELLEMEEQEK